MPDTQPDTRAPAIGQTRHRAVPAASVQVRAVDPEARTAEIAFSSETPVEIMPGVFEILDHSPRAIRLDRLRNGGPLMAMDTAYGGGHRDGRLVGAVQSVEVGKDRIGRAVVRYGRNGYANDVFADVQDGMRQHVSVGYLIHDVRLERSGGDGDTYRVTDWEPIEITHVPIPADPSVGVGRAHHPRHPETAMPETNGNTPAGDTPANTPEQNTPTQGQRAQQTTPESQPAPAAAPAGDSATGSIRAQQEPAGPGIDWSSANARAILEVGRHFDMEAQARNHIVLGGDLESFRQQVRASIPESQPIPLEPARPAARVEGRIPYGGNLRAFSPERFGSRHAAEEMAYRAGQFYRAVMLNDTGAERWCRDHGIPVKTRAVDGGGPGQSALIPSELSNTLISLKEQYGLAAQVCEVVNMTSESRTIAVDTSDISAQWVGAGTAADESEPGFGYVTLNAKRLRARTLIDNDYADDSIIDLAEHVADKQARAFAIAEDKALFNGDGTSTYGGIVGIRTKILSLAGAVDAASGHDTFAEITAADLRKVIAQLPDIPGIDPSWYCSKYAQEQLFGRLADAAGGNTKRDLASGEQMQWAGYRIRTSPVLPKVSTDLSDVAMLLFGDLRLGVLMGQRKTMEMAVNPYILMAEGQTEILGFERIDFNAHGVGDSSSAGPIVALIGE